MILHQRDLTYKKLAEYDVALKYLKILKEKYIKDKTMLLKLMADKAKTLNINYCLSYAKISEYYRGRNEGKSIYFSNELIDKLKQI